MHLPNFKRKDPGFFFFLSVAKLTQKIELHIFELATLQFSFVEIRIHFDIGSPYPCQTSHRRPLLEGWHICAAVNPSMLLIVDIWNDAGANANDRYDSAAYVATMVWWAKRSCTKRVAISDTNCFFGVFFWFGWLKKFQTFIFSKKCKLYCVFRKNSLYWTHCMKIISMIQKIVQKPHL